MPRFLSLRLIAVLAPLLLVILLASVGLTVWQLSRASDVWCEAAHDPDAYADEWFYTLQRGPDGWLLRHDDLREDFTVDDQTRAYLTRLSQALHAEGVILIVAAQPPRGVALAESGVEGYDPRAALQGYESAWASLTDAGVLTADLATAALETPDYFFKRDHHWTPEGADASAQAVAALVRATDVYTSLEPHPYQTERVDEEAQLGSYGEAVGRVCGRNPPAERFTRYQTHLQTPPQDAAEQAPAGEGLFGDTVAPPLALAGTSNSASEEFNFAGFLEQHTGLGVLNVSAVGGGPEAALEAFLRSETFIQSPPRFLVWEFATLFDLPSDPVFYRQLIPSVGGACSLEASVLSTSYAPQGADARTTRLFGEANAGYLYLEASDLSLVDFGVEVSYQGGESETVRVERPTRTANNGRFFLELNGQVSSLELRLPEGVGGEITARLCPG